MARPEGSDRARALRLVRAHILRLAGRLDRPGPRPAGRDEGGEDDDDDPGADDGGPDDEGPRPAA
jgi:hypothetical protein